MIKRILYIVSILLRTINEITQALLVIIYTLLFTIPCCISWIITGQFSIVKDIKYIYNTGDKYDEALKKWGNISK